MIHPTTSLRSRVISMVAAWLVSSPLCAQLTADQSSQAPTLRFGSMVDVVQLLASEPPAAQLAQRGIVPSAEWPYGREASFRLSQADAVASPPLIGTADGLPDTAATKFGGFLELVPAYTYSNPSHWSRATGRIQLTAKGEFADQVKWKVGARVDVDPVYYSSNFYLDPVKHDQRFDFFEQLFVERRVVAFEQCLAHALERLLRRHQVLAHLFETAPVATDLVGHDAQEGIVKRKRDVSMVFEELHQLVDGKLE